MEDKLSKNKAEVLAIIDGNNQANLDQIDKVEKKLISWVNEGVSDLREYNRIQDKKSDDMQTRVIEVVTTNQKMTQKVKNLTDAFKKLRDEMDALDMTQYVQKSQFREELRAFQNTISEIRLASDEKYLFKAVYKEFSEDAKSRLTSLRFDNDNHSDILTKLDLSLIDMTKKLKEQQLGKADAKQVTQLMEKINLFKNQLEEYRYLIAEMTKKMDVVDDVQLLKTKIDQTQKALNSKIDNKFKEEIRGNFNNLNKDMQNCKDEVIKGANEIKNMYKDLQKIYDKLTFLDLDKMNKDE